VFENFDLRVSVVNIVNLGAQGRVSFLAFLDHGPLDTLSGLVAVGSQDFGFNFLGGSVDGDLLPGLAEPIGALVASVEGDSVVIDLLDF